jgi:hypothetical protein
MGYRYKNFPSIAGIEAYGFRGILPSVRCDSSSPEDCFPISPYEP